MRPLVHRRPWYAFSRRPTPVTSPGLSNSCQVSSVVKSVLGTSSPSTGSILLHSYEVWPSYRPVFGLVGTSIKLVTVLHPRPTSPTLPVRYTSDPTLGSVLPLYPSTFLVLNSPSSTSVILWYEHPWGPSHTRTQLVCISVPVGEICVYTRDTQCV